MRRFGLTILIALSVLTPNSSAATPPNLVTFEQTGGFASIERGFAVLDHGGGRLGRPARDGEAPEREHVSLHCAPR